MGSKLHIESSATDRKMISKEMFQEGNALTMISSENGRGKI
jgi:hypothetical protein